MSEEEEPKKRSYYEQYIPLSEIKKIFPKLDIEKVGKACVRVLITDECKEVTKYSIKGENWGKTHLGDLWSEEDVDLIKTSIREFKEGIPATAGQLLGVTPIRKKRRKRRK